MIGWEPTDAHCCISLDLSEQEVNQQYVGMCLKDIKSSPLEASSDELCDSPLNVLKQLGGAYRTSRGVTICEFEWGDIPNVQHICESWDSYHMVELACFTG